MERICSALGVVALIVGMSAAAMGATAIGVVAAPQGQTLSGIQIYAKDEAGHVVGQAATGGTGKYEIPNLQPGKYNFTLDPGSSGVQGQTVSSYVGQDGICLNWGVSPTAPAVATAQPGATCTLLAADPPFDPAPWVGAGAVVIGGTAIGLAVGLGSGSDHNSRAPVSTGQ
jgi:hypothetical protein